MGLGWARLGWVGNVCVWGSVCYGMFIGCVCGILAWVGVMIGMDE